MWTNKIPLSWEKGGYPQYPQPLLLLREQLATSADLNRLGPHLWKTCGPLVGRPKAPRPHSLFQSPLTLLPPSRAFPLLPKLVSGTLEPLGTRRRRFT